MTGKPLDPPAFVPDAAGTAAGVVTAADTCEGIVFTTDVVIAAPVLPAARGAAVGVVTIPVVSAASTLVRAAMAKYEKPGVVAVK